MKAVGSSVARMTFVGSAAALAAAIPLGLVMVSIHGAWAVSVLFGLMVGGFLAGFITVFEHMWYGRPGHSLSRTVVSTAAGAMGGALGASAGQALFMAWGVRLVDSAVAGIALPLSAGSAVGWGLTGLAVGLAITVPFASGRDRWLPASFGGFAGGLAGGTVMQLFRPLFGTGSLIMGLLVLGGATGLGIAWIQRTMAHLRLQILDGPGRGSEFALGRSAVIGADSRCSVRLTGAGVAQRHARITFREGRAVIEDLGSPRGLRLNDRKVSGQAAALRHGDLIRIGDSLLRINAPGIARARAAAAVALLLCLVAPVQAAAEAEPSPEWRITQVDTSRYPMVDLYAILPGEARPSDIRSVTVTEAGREASVVEVRDLKQGVRDVPLTVSVVLDVSQSMAGEKMEEMKKALSRFSQTIPSDARVHLVVFSDKVSVRARDVSPDLLGQYATGITASGHTALFDAVRAGVGLLEGAAGRRAVLTMTDGKANRGSVSMEESLLAAERSGVSLMFVGLGSDARRNRLTGMALRTGGKAVYTSEPEVLSTLFEGMAEEISREVLFRYRAASRAEQVVPVALRVSTRTGQVEVGSRYFSPRATFMGTSGHGSWLLVLLGLLGPIGLVAAGRLTSFNLSADRVMLVEGSAQATRMLTRVLTRHGMTVPVSIGGETLLVNNRPVSGTRTLRPGETLTWGETTILYRDR
ncbi:MAG: VWA domain-containing protein [bacterium]|nr:MAG: VWA domain-containing protein [bacterium]